MRPTPYILAVDIGSSAVKAGLYDAEARALLHTQASIQHQQRTAADGSHDEDAKTIQDATEAAIDRALQLAGEEADHIAAVGFDAMASTILGVDNRHNPITPVFTYADTRSAQDVDNLQYNIDVDDAYQRTGVMQHTSYVPGRVLWFRRTEPQTAERIARWTDITTFLFTRWFGSTNIPASYSVSAWSGLLNRHSLDWDTKLLDAIDLQASNLPPLAPYNQPQTGLCPVYTLRWPQLAEVPFFLAVGDGAAVNIGSGCTDRRNVALTVGTTGAMRLVVDHPGDNPPPTVPKGLWGYILRGDRTLLGGAFSEGGNVVEWAVNNLNLPPLEELNENLTDATPDGHGLTVLPFIAGERAVGWSTNASGVFNGVRVSTTGLDILQALMESVAYRFSLVADLLQGEMTEDRVFIAGGGAMTNSPWWLQTISDVLQGEVHVPAEEQATSRGAAILALNAIGEWKSLADLMPEIAKVYYPREEFRNTYRAAIDRQSDLYSTVIDR
ncbi:MAG: gluconokinase [Chloroflexi bacterium]|nr:gluconokinase [Chloroflexota bacterium]